MRRKVVVLLHQGRYRDIPSVSSTPWQLLKLLIFGLRTWGSIEPRLTHRLQQTKTLPLLQGLLAREP